MLNKKILLSIFTLGVISVMAASATFGYFEDTETSTGNSLTAGTFNLIFTSPFSVNYVAPGANGKQNLSMTNSGTINGKLDITLSSITNSEGTSTEFEPTPGTTGELGGALTMAIFVDADNTSTLTSGDIALKASGSQSGSDVSQISGNPEESEYFTIVNSYGGRTWDSSLLSLNANQTRNLVFYWKFPYGSSASNTTQGDGVSFDITGLLEQRED